MHHDSFPIFAPGNGRWTSPEGFDETDPAAADVGALRSACDLMATFDDKNDNAGRQGEAIRLALLKAEAMERAKATFLATMSHEFRTPLNAIIGFASLLRDDLADNPACVRDYASAIETAGLRLQQLLVHILELADIEADASQLVSEPVDLAKLLRRSVEAIKDQGALAMVDVDSAIPKHLPTILGDQRRLRLVFDQLLSNAVKFTPAGGHVRLSAMLSDGIEVQIEDDGIGMPADQITRILEAFEQLEGPFARKYHGAGVGLTLANRLVTLHGGRLSMTSMPNIGTSVSVHLPLA